MLSIMIFSKIMCHNILIYEVITDNSFIAFNITSDLNLKPTTKIVLNDDHSLSLIPDSESINIFII